MKPNQSNPLAILFTRVNANAHPCRCGHPGYCPCHGTHEPASSDPEILEAVAEGSRGRPEAVRVIRKQLAR